MGAAGGLAAASIHAAGPVSTSRQPHAVLIRWNQPGPPPRRSPRGKGLAQAWCSKRRVSSSRNTLSCITSAARGAGSTNATAAAAAAAAGAGADGLDAAGESASGEATGNPLESRSMAEMLAFAAPALGMVLADPLMSLIDTACVGRVSSLQLAALGPNTAIFSLCFQLFAFLGIGTTNLIASNSLRDPALDSGTRQLRQETAERTLCNSLLLAVASGLLITTALLLGGRRFLAAMGTAPELLHPAWQYMSIRVLAAPASLVMAVAQGACLGQQDAWTPFKVLLAVVLLSAGGDLYLIYGRGMGVVGAAAATAAAQYFGAAYSLWYLQHKGSAPGGIRLRWTGLPRAGQMNQFLAIASTLFTRTIFGMAAYFSMTSSAAQMGTIVTAAHQVAMQTFWFLAYFPEPLSLAAQTLLARDKGQPTQAAYWAWLLLRAGVALGLVLAAAVGAAFTWGAALFTSDAAVQVAVRQLAPVAMLAAAICSVMMAFDGISVGSGKFAHLPPSNVIGLAATLATLHAGRQAGLGLVAVWWALVAFYGTRLVGHLLHYWHARGGVFAAGGWQSSSGSSAVADGAAI